MRRITAALQAVIATAVNVVTLPFRVLSRLIGGGGSAPARRTRRPRGRAA
jgi:hypothetical protein